MTTTRNDDFPDRDLDPPADLPAVAVRSGGSAHPFFYRKMVQGPVRGSRAEPGDLVRIINRDGEPVGYGFWNPRSEIALRLVTTRDEPPDRAFWKARVEAAVRLRREMLGLDGRSDSYRLIHAEADGFSGLVVDRIGDVLSAEVFSLGMQHRLGPLLDLIAESMPCAYKVARVDSRVAFYEGMRPQSWVTPGAPEQVAIREDGIRYRVKFAGGHKTGFFCDQRDNRKELAKFCRDKDVLDVCCYAGGFALSARVAGGARDVTAVDLDENAVAAARENANLNQVRINLVHADAFGYMRQMATNGKKFGVVVLDPPKLINDREEISSGKRKYYDMNLLAMRLVEPGGLLLTCSCSGLLHPEEFIILLRAAARNAGREAQLLGLTGAAPDHPVALNAPEGAYLKAAWLRLGDAIPIPLPSSMPTWPRSEGPPPSRSD